MLYAMKVYLLDRGMNGQKEPVLVERWVFGLSYSEVLRELKFNVALSTGDEQIEVQNVEVIAMKDLEKYLALDE